MQQYPLGNLAQLPVTADVCQDESPRAVKVPVDFTSSGAWSLDLTLMQQGGQIKTVRTIYVDNGTNNTTVTVVIVGTQQTIIAQPQTQGYYPVLSTQAAQFTFSGSGHSTVYLLNFRMPGFVWGYNAESGTVQVADAILDACVTDDVLAVSISGGLANPLPVSEANLDACISGGKVSVSDVATASLAALITGGKFPVIDSSTVALAALIAAGKLSVSDAAAEGFLGTLAGIVVGGAAQVSVSNFPATQPVSGSVSVSNFPATQPVSEATLDGCISANKVAVTDAAAETSLSTLAGIVSGGSAQVTVGNFPGTQAISGSVDILDSSGNSLTGISGTTSLTGRQGVPVMGSDGTHLRWLSVTTAGLLNCAVSLLKGTTAVSGQVTMTGSAIQLVNSSVNAGLLTLTAKKSNTNPIYVGTSGVTNSTGYILEAGVSVQINVADPNVLYVIGTTGDICSFIVT